MKQLDHRGRDGDREEEAMYVRPADPAVSHVAPVKRNEGGSASASGSGCHRRCRFRAHGAALPRQDWHPRVYPFLPGMIGKSKLGR